MPKCCEVRAYSELKCDDVTHFCNSEFVNSGHTVWTRDLKQNSCSTPHRSPNSNPHVLYTELHLAKPFLLLYQDQ
jgi:hypothetical protein